MDSDFKKATDKKSQIHQMTIKNKLNIRRDIKLQGNKFGEY